MINLFTHKTILVAGMLLGAASLYWNSSETLELGEETSGRFSKAFQTPEEYDNYVTELFPVEPFKSQVFESSEEYNAFVDRLFSSDTLTTPKVSTVVSKRFSKAFQTLEEYDNYVTELFSVESFRSQVFESSEKYNAFVDALFDGSNQSISQTEITSLTCITIGSFSIGAAVLTALFGTGGIALPIVFVAVAICLMDTGFFLQGFDLQQVNRIEQLRTLNLTDQKDRKKMSQALSNTFILQYVIPFKRA